MENNKRELNSPVYMTISPINIDRKQGQRLMTVYRTRECEYYKKGKGCTMCGFASQANSEIKTKNIKTQHKQSLETLRNANFIHFDLLTLGNFYNNREFSCDLRESLLESLAKVPGLKRVLTEARREYITVEKLKEAKNYLRDNQTLEYALGYETVNSNLRNRVLMKGTPENYLDESLKICREAGVDFVSYVLIKPHTLTEAESIKEAVNTATHVLQKAEKYGVNARIAFEPVFVTKGTIIENLWKKGKYFPPKLWSVAEVIIQTANNFGMNNTQGKFFVGLSDENLSEDRMTSNCGSCDDKIQSEIQRFNGHQDVTQLKKLYHKCKDEWEQEIRNS